MNFENRLAIFDIHRSLKSKSSIVAQRGGRTESVFIAVNWRDVDDWANGERFATRYSRAQISAFSPTAGALLEVESERDVEILVGMYSRSILLANSDPAVLGASYKQGDFNLTSASRLPKRRSLGTIWQQSGLRLQVEARRRGGTTVV